MNKKQLIKLLEPYPDDQRIMVDGYEGGYDNPFVKQATVCKELHNSWDGEYEEPRNIIGGGKKSRKINVVVISRYKG